MNTKLALIVVLALTPSLRAQHINGAGVPTAGTQPTDTTVITGEPLEHRKPWGNGQSPAFPGQTRAPSTKTQTPLDIKIITNQLRKPWALAFLPDGNFLINEKPGTMRIVTPDGKLSDPILGVPNVIYKQDAGLMDLQLDPNFSSTRTLYFAYVEPRGGDTNGTVIAKAQLSADSTKLENLTTLLRIEPASNVTAHYGARILIAPDGTLFISNGERYDPPNRPLAQSLNSHMGKIFHLNPDGSPVKTNPFINTPNTLPEVYSYGHRNPQGLAFHPLTGELWSTEHGPQGGDEINIIQPGKNYGWPIIAYGTEYSGAPVGQGITAKDGMEQPIYYWNPAVAPSGCTFYTADLIPEWKNNFFIACLAGQHIVRLVIGGEDHKILAEERLLLDMHQRFRDIRQAPDGALYTITDENEGTLIRIAPK